MCRILISILGNLCLVSFLPIMVLQQTASAADTFQRFEVVLGSESESGAYKTSTAVCPEKFTAIACDAYEANHSFHGVSFSEKISYFGANKSKNSCVAANEKGASGVVAVAVCANEKAVKSWEVRQSTATRFNFTTCKDKNYQMTSCTPSTRNYPVKKSPA